MSRCIIHIGTEKTGTTALQGWLSTRAEILEPAGFHFCESMGSPNNIRLAALAQNYGKYDDLRISLGVRDREGIDELQKECARLLKAELAKHPDQTFLFSSEHCHSRLVELNEVERLRDFTQELFDDVRIVVYLRRQDKVAVSLYSTMLKVGGARKEILDFSAVSSAYYNYFTLLRRWCGAFGQENVEVRLFESDALIGGTVVSDFCEAFGVPYDGSVERSNESIRPDYQKFLLLMNEALPRRPDGAANLDRGDLSNVVYDIGKGPGQLPRRQDAERFYAMFAESNEKVREQFFPDRPQLFAADFTSYPETDDTADLSAERLSEIFAEVWARATRRNRNLRRQLEEARAKK